MEKRDSEMLMSAFLETEREKDQTLRFGERLRQIRKELGENQDEFAARIGTSKQVLSRYEKGQRIPKISLLEGYARSLHVSVDYLMGNTDLQETAFNSLCPQDSKPFYQIFLEVMQKMELTSFDVARLTGLTPWKVQTITDRRLKEAPLSLALLLSKSLNVPLTVWTGDESYKAAEITIEAHEVAAAYDKATAKDKDVIRTILELPLEVKHE